MDLKIGAVILAAGGSTRFGTPKQVLQVAGRPMLQHVIDLVKSIEFDKTALVLGANQAEIVAHLVLDDRITVVHNPDWQLGQSSSVRKGVETLEKDCDAIMFFLGDQPFLTKDLVVREIQVYTERKPEILVPVFNGSRGNPVIFGKVCFQDLKGMQGDQGGRAIFPAHQVVEMEWTNAKEGMDIDTRSDYGGSMDVNQIAHRHISIIILAAGLSTRMQQPKLVLPWGKSTILGTVIAAFKEAGVGEIIVVTGGSKDLVEKEANKHQARCEFNPKFENGEMADSLKTGLLAIMKGNSDAVFVALADHPFIASHDIAKMIDIYEHQKPKLIVPSYSMRKGHPWLIDRELWPSIMNIQPPDTMREFVNAHSDQITYYVVEKSNILEDLDTPEDYKRLRPQ